MVLNGVFTAFPVGILIGFLEVVKRFDVQKMRSHLLKCLEENEFILFARSRKHARLS